MEKPNIIISQNILDFVNEPYRSEIIKKAQGLKQYKEPENEGHLKLLPSYAKAGCNNEVQNAKTLPQEVRLLEKETF